MNITNEVQIKPVFTMLVGIPGSGKSTFAEAAQDETTKYLSSDAIRGELYGDEGCQNDPGRVFGLMHKRTIEALKNGYNVIYDATNITRKSRRGILSQLPSYVIKKCVVIWAPIETCIARDAARGRTVGEGVIWKMLTRFEAPFYDEGFDDIRLVVPEEFYDQAIISNYFDACMKALHISHDNPHHTLGVSEHCQECGKMLLDVDVPEVVKCAGFIHDIGKPNTKTFINTKGETTEVAHYYGHQAVGAWMSYGISCNFSYEAVVLAWLVSTHMAPFINQKYYNSLDHTHKSWIDALHTADLAAH